MKRSLRPFKPDNLLQQFIHAALLCSVLLSVLLFSTAVQAGSTTSGWTPQQRIPNYGDESRAPYMVADQDGSVYAFNTQSDGPSSQAIFIRQWSLTQSWSPPTDILLSPLPGAPVVYGAYLDSAGIIHLIFFAGNEMYGAIYYSWAPAYLADEPQAWATPVLIGDNSTGLGTGMTGDDQGDLFVVFGGKQNGVGLYGTVSEDSGKTWSDPQLITLMEDTNLLPSNTDVVADPQRQAHAVWSEVDETGIDHVIYYSRLSADHQSLVAALHHRPA